MAQTAPVKAAAAPNHRPARLIGLITASLVLPVWYPVNGILHLQFGHFQRFITARIVDILGRGGLNHGGVADDVCRSALTEGLGLKLFTHECYQVLAGGTPRSGAPLG